MARPVKHTHRSLTPDEKQRVTETRRSIPAEEPEIRRNAKEYKHSYEAARATLRDAVKVLKAERERMGLSLADVAKRTGIDALICHGSKINPMPIRPSLRYCGMRTLLANAWQSSWPTLLPAADQG